MIKRAARVVIVSMASVLVYLGYDLVGEVGSFLLPVYLSTWSVLSGT